MSEQNAAVLDELLEPAEESHPVSTDTISEWSSYASTNLTSAAFDVIIAASETDARRAEEDYRHIFLRNLENYF